MRKLTKWAILPEMGEIMDVKDVYGAEVGDPATNKMMFGSARTLSENPTVVCIAWMTGSVTETMIKWSFSGSVFSTMIGGLRAIIIATHPNAEIGDAGVIAWKTIGEMGKNTHHPIKKPFTFFVSGDGKDPAGKRYVTKYVPNGEGGKTLEKVEVPSGNALLPRKQYYTTIRRLNKPDHEENPPMNCTLRGTNDPDNGGEVSIDVTNMVGDLEGFDIDLGPLGSGLFIPDK
jgi:hypothetical protein